MTEELLSIALPKWPQMYVTGEPVTNDQAKEIIFRTDGFLTDYGEYAGGNNRGFNEQYRRKSGLSRITEATRYRRIENPTDEQTRRDSEMMSAGWDAGSEIRERAGFISTEYVHNTWASSSFIGGPHGWCAPSGKIFYENNVGKWPSVEEILNEWGQIAAAFPFLKLTATLFSGEECEDDRKALVSIIVSDGKATLSPPIHEPVLVTFEDKFDLAAIFSSSDREQGLPPAWVDEYAARVRTIVDEVLADERFAVLRTA